MSEVDLEKLKSFVELREKEGWIWEIWYDEVKALVPPIGDCRRNWATEWHHISENVIVPAYITIPACIIKNTKSNITISEAIDNTMEPIVSEICKSKIIDDFSSEKIEKYYKLIEKRIQEGWKWCIWDEEKEIKVLLPPMNSKYIKCAAEWFNLDSKTIIPSYIECEFEDSH